MRTAMVTALCVGALMTAPALAQAPAVADWNARADAAEARVQTAKAAFDAGRWEEGEREVRAAEAVFSEPGHPPREAQAAALTLLGDSYLRWGRYEDARSTLTQALALWEARKGPEEPALLPTLSSLATLLLTIGEDGAAEPLFRRQLAIAEKAEPGGGAMTAKAMLDLALMYSQAGREDEANTLYQTAEATLERVSPNDPALGNAYREHSLNYIHMGDGPNAVGLAQRAMAATERTAGAESEAAGTAHLTLARVYFQVGKNDEAIAEGQRGLDIYRKTLSSDNPRLGDAIFQLGFGAQRKLDRDNAEKYYAESVAVMLAERPPHHESVVYARSSLSQQIMRGGKEPERAYQTSRLAADPLRARVLANARLVGRGGSPTLTTPDRNVFFIAVRSGWAYAGAAKAP